MGLNPQARDIEEKRERTERNRTSTQISWKFSFIHKLQWVKDLSAMYYNKKAHTQHTHTQRIRKHNP